MSGFRLQKGGRIDRSRPLDFRFDGRSHSGYRGDTIASALLANGVMVFGRSFKYHRPRGLLASGSEEPNALLTITRDAVRVTPNTRANVQDLYDGLSAHSQNRWPSLEFDFGAINDGLSPLFSAGFYYKTFMWPRRFWDWLYEPLIRGAAGLGRAPETEDPDVYASRYAHCDVLIVGAGPAGLAAALTAGEAGTKVMLVDEQAELGGSLLANVHDVIGGQPAVDWLARTIATLEALPNVTLLSRSTAIGHYHQNFVAVAQRLTDHLDVLPDGAPRERLWRVRAKEVVFAQGAIERPLVFAGNDRPGVMLANAAGTFLGRFGVAVGRAPLIVTNHDSAWGVAMDFVTAGIKPCAIVDLRADPPADLVVWAQSVGVPVYLGHTIASTKGRRGVRSAQLISLSGVPGHTISCDAVLMSGGWTPSVHLHSHAKGKLDWLEDREMFVPGRADEAVQSAGAGNGAFSLLAALKEGHLAGLAASGGKGKATYHVEERSLFSGGTLRAPVGVYGKAFVDFQNDVTAKDIGLAVREGFHSIEHIKRYTTTGMATDQGKTSNINGLRLAADAVAKSVPEVGLTTFRPPYTPTTFGALANYARGAGFDPLRKTVIDTWAEENGAVFEPVGLWRRARYFPQSGEDIDHAVVRECKAVREDAGLFDASTLGKIEIVGPDAAAFLERLYTIPVKSLKPGRCRYALLLGEDGFIRDDGIIARLSDTHFHVTTTTGGAASVYARMEDYLQTEWPELQVWATSTTEQWAVISVNGPKARAIIADLVEGVDLDNAALPHMSVTHGHICGVPMRLFRVSFTGELGYEINVPASDGAKVWAAVYAAGLPHGITPYGTEAVHVLRAEKGYIIVGQETDGTITPGDLGMNWAIGKNKIDFIGKPSLQRADMQRADCRQLVGLFTEDRGTVLEEGAQITVAPDQPIPMDMIGRVTSSYFSPTLGRSIALGLVAGGRGLMGQEIFVPMPDKVIKVRVVSPVFYDPDGGRLNV